MGLNCAAALCNARYDGGMIPGRQFASHKDTLVLLYLSVSALGPYRAIDAQTTELDRYIGKDLWKHPLSQREELRLEKIVGKVPKGYMMEPHLGMFGK